MAFNTAPGRAEYTASAAQTKFTFAFKIYNTSDVKVYLTPSGQSPDDTADILIETTDYTVTINGDNGGDVDLTSGASLNDSITLVRELPIGRNIEYQNNGDLTAGALNEDQDYQTYLILDGNLVNERALTVPESAQGFNTSVPSPGAGKMFIYAQDGKSIELVDPSSTSFFKDAFIVDSMSVLLSVDESIYGSVNVRGYHSSNDGGGGLFNWDATVDKSTANAGTIIDPDQTLANQGDGTGNGCWVRQDSDNVNALWFGAKGDGTTDDTTAIQNAIDSITKGTVYLSTGAHLISSSLVVPNGISLIGDPKDTEILMSSSGTFTNDYGILVNSTDGVSWVASYPGINVGKIEFIKMNTSVYANAHKGIFLASSYKLENLRFSRMVTSIQTVSEYLDSVCISQINCGYGEDGGYQIVIGSLGDGLFVNSVLCHQGSQKALYISRCAGGLVTGMINGDIELSECSALKVSGVHNEYGQIIIDSSSVSIENSYLWDNDKPAIKFISTNAGRTTCSLKDIAFKYALDDTDNATLSDYNIQLIATTTVSINNLSRQILKTGALDVVETMGVLVADSSGTPLDSFNDYSYFLSGNSFINYSYIIELNKQLIHNDATFYPFSSIGLSTYVTWKIATDTYYYDVSIIRDKTRLIGRPNQGGDETVTATNGGSGVLISLGTSGNNPNSFYRVYRGTSTNSYTEYVDIPFIATSKYYDDGETLNGFKWKSRTAADVESVTLGIRTIFNSGNVELFRSSAPTVGTWELRDMVINPSPAAGGKIGWVCITAGTPGTWKAFGAIDA